MAPSTESRADGLHAAVERAKQQYAARNPASAAYTEAARASMPGGNTRSTLYYEPFPLVFSSATGSVLTTLDGHELVDFLSDFTAGLYGHSHPTIVSALHDAVDEGLSFGGYNPHEARLAEQLAGRFPSIDLVRFTNSGTEANLLAIAAAIAHTGRSTVIVFSGGYHGSVLSFAAGSGSINVPYRFRVVEYNDADGLQLAMTEVGDDLAAILIEPMLGSGGCIPADVSFLEQAREACDRLESVLIFDEVMTSRLSPGGLQRTTGVAPDLTTLGKYLGGGMSFGALGGRAEVMARFDPSHPSPLAHPGTFNNNVLTMRAGATALEEILDERTLDGLNHRGDVLRSALNDVFAEHGLPMQVTGRGSLMTVHATGAAVRSPRDLADADATLQELYFFFMVDQGFWMARRTMLALNLAITDEHCVAFVESTRTFAERYGQQIRASASV